MYESVPFFESLESKCRHCESNCKSFASRLWIGDSTNVVVVVEFNVEDDEDDDDEDDEASALLLLLLLLLLWSSLEAPAIRGRRVLLLLCFELPFGI